MSKLILFILLFQLLLNGVTQIKPGVLGYASNISSDEVLRMTNSERQAKGLKSLSLNSTLSQSAKEKAQDMFAKNYWAHNAPDGTTPWAFFKNVGYHYLYAGENLARDFGDSVAVVRAWMDSPTHRDNILSDRYNEIGIAVVNGILNGQETTLVVQHFGKESIAAPVVAEAAATEIESAPAAEETKASSSLGDQAYQEKVSQTIPQINTVAQAPVETDTHTVTTPELRVNQSTAKPIISAFDLTKSINIALSLVVILVLFLDGFLIWHRKTVRRAGKSFVHLSLFVLIALIMILTGSGKII